MSVEALWNQSYASLCSSNAPDSIQQTAKAWTVSERYLSPKDISASSLAPSQDVLNALQLLRSVHSTETLLLQFLESITANFYRIRPVILKAAAQWEETEDLNVIFGLLDTLADYYNAWQQPLKAVGSGSEQLLAYRDRFHTALFPCFPTSFGSALYGVFEHLLASREAETSSSARVVENMHTLGLINRYKPILLRYVYDQIEIRVNSTCAGEWTESELEKTHHWFGSEIANWVRSILHPGKSPEDLSNEQDDELMAIFTRFEYHLYRTMGSLRTDELFDIIVEYPDSQAALTDLKTCLGRTDERKSLATRLRAANEKRLLHPGADTKDIINQYISTIRCLRILDPQGVLLSRVATPIREYLRAREDTIRCIMTALLDENGELAEELEKEGGGSLESTMDEAEDYSDPNWQPDPIDAPINFHLSKSSDIIQMLVSIYDTKDVFIKEFQVLLASSLIATKEYDADRQIRNVEILKRRFGESSLQLCEVMIKDIADSKRADQLVSNMPDLPLKPRSIVHPLVLSRIFWPGFQNTQFRLPGTLGNYVQNYNNKFNQVKLDKKLQWLFQLGTVELEIELKDRTLSLEVTPLQAAIVECFKHTNKHTTSALAEKLHMTEDSAMALLKNNLFFWVNAGLLREETADRVQSWTLLEEAEKGTPAKQRIIEEEAPALESVQQQQVEQLRVYWQYIMGMLTNLGALPANRIHMTLSRVLPAYRGRTVEELTAFLQQLEREGTVQAGPNGAWRLTRPS